MSLEKAIGYLKTLGLTDADALVYIFLAKKGPCAEDDIAYTLNLTAEKLHLSLKALMAKGMIRHITKNPNSYFAIPFEKIFDENSKVSNEKLKALLATKAALLDTFQSAIKSDK